MYVVAGLVLLTAFVVAVIAAVMGGESATKSRTPPAEVEVAPLTFPELREVRATEVEGRVAIRIVLEDPAVSDGAEIFVWTLDAVAGPGPIRLLRQDGMWTIDEVASASIDASGSALVVSLDRVPDGVAVSTTGIDRIPDIGHLTPDADGGEATAIDGAGATEIERSVAEVERGFGVLNPSQRELAVSLLARQMIAGTWTYDLRVGDGVSALAVVSVRYPELSQVIDGGSGLYASRDGAQSCSVSSGVRACHASSLARFPAGAAAALVRHPLDVDVAELPAAERDGLPTRCMRVTSSLVDGPSPGRWCWAADGSVVVAELDNGLVTTLVSRSALAEASLAAPDA